MDYIINFKIKKEHLENYFKYLFIQLNNFINKYNNLKMSQLSLKKV